MVNLGRALGMDIVAEGIETEYEAVMMTRFGCTELQGFYFSRPLPVAEMVDFLETYEAQPPKREIGAIHAVASGN